MGEIWTIRSWSWAERTTWNVPGAQSKVTWGQARPVPVLSLCPAHFPCAHSFSFSQLVPFLVRPAHECSLHGWTIVREENEAWSEQSETNGRQKEGREPNPRAQVLSLPGFSYGTTSGLVQIPWLVHSLLVAHSLLSFAIGFVSLM